MVIKFGQFARLKRTEAGISIARCAAGLGITPDAYLKKERDERGWSLEDVEKLAAVYGLQASGLLAEFEATQT